MNKGWKSQIVRENKTRSNVVAVIYRIRERKINWGGIPDTWRSTKIYRSDMRLYCGAVFMNQFSS